jgi:hypothetical protein
MFTGAIERKTDSPKNIFMCSKLVITCLEAFHLTRLCFYVVIACQHPTYMPSITKTYIDHFFFFRWLVASGTLAPGN